MLIFRVIKRRFKQATSSNKKKEKVSLDQSVMRDLDAEDVSFEEIEDKK